MLDAQTIATVKATIPLLVETGPKLTAHFYDRMFTHNPELKEIFNMSNQRNGDQREALFNAIAAYASNIENLPALLPAVEKSRRSTPASRSNRNSTTSSVNTCWQRWTKCSARGRKCWTRGVKPMVYWLMYLSIARRKSITKTPAKPVVGKVLAISALWLKHRAARLSPASNWSVDGGAVAEYRPGQYLGVWLKPEGFPHQEIRQYSLTRKPDGKGYRIAVKREEGGQVSNWLHNHANVGDVVKLVAPAGDFFMAVADDTPVTLISAGVGQTPMLAMLDTLAKAGHTAQVNWFHAAENGDVHAFADEVKELGQSLPRFTAHTWYRQPSEADRAKGQFDSEGLMDLSKLEGAFSDPTMQFYLCGPVGFMQFTAKQLVDLGVKQENIHYECFGPHKVL